LEPYSAAPKTLQIPKGVKVFLNIAWDENVPSPPPVDEATVRRAMMGEDLDDAVGIGEGAYYVPVVVSEPREDRDKAGKPSVVFDAVFNNTLKSRCTKDPDFKLYIIELALEHVEEKAHIALSRQIGTPNIASKGKLEPRTVLIPTSLLAGSSTQGKAVISESKPLIREVTEASSKGSFKQSTSSGHTPSKSILKKSSAPSTSQLESTSITIPNTTAAGSKTSRPLIEELPGSSASVSEDVHPIDLNAADFLPVPKWSWAKEGKDIRIEIEVPKLTRALHVVSALDIEAQRILLYIPKTYFLDIKLDVSDAQIGKLRSMSIESSPQVKEKKELDIDELRIKGHNAGEALRLKRQRDLDVDNARAEWRISERRVVIWV